MKAGLALLLACVLLLCGACVGVAEEHTMPQVPWLTYTLGVKCVADSPASIEGNPEPVDERFILMSFKALGEKILIFDIVENIAMFSLADAEGQKYPAAAYFPRTMLFLFTPGVFSTAQAQGAFDVLFVIPKDIPLEGMTLWVEEQKGGQANSVPLPEVELLPDEL